jgi:hypothetical protein
MPLRTTQGWTPALRPVRRATVDASRHVVTIMMPGIRLAVAPIAVVLMFARRIAPGYCALETRFATEDLGVLSPPAVLVQGRVRRSVTRMITVVARADAFPRRQNRRRADANCRLAIATNALPPRRCRGIDFCCAAKQLEIRSPAGSPHPGTRYFGFDRA